MAHSNLALRGSTYWWRRKVTVAGHRIPVALSVGTGNYLRSRGIAERLAVELEALRMAYGERGTQIDAATLKKIFNQAMRWQLERILSDQIGSSAPVAEHHATNRLYAELWRLHARSGPDAEYTANDDDRLKAADWPAHDRSALATLWEEARHSESRISHSQTDDYAMKFGYANTTTNLDKVRRVIYGARALACDEATSRLGKDNGDFSGWMEDALADKSPFTFDLNDDEPTEAEASSRPRSAPDVPPARALTFTSGSSARAAAPEPVHQAEEAPSRRPKKLLTVAASECIAAYIGTEAWSPNTVTQVRTSIRLFDFACGEDVFIEDITQRHVTAFRELCEAIPNRWGKTTAEMAGGLATSVELGMKMDASKRGMSPTTLNKHITWITQVLDFVAGENGEGHEPVSAISFKKLRKGFGKASGRTRARDRRAAWSRSELARLLEASIWKGCRGIDERFKPGQLVLHDAWYWLPLMFILYGGRSSELVGLPLSDVHEHSEIPYFKVDYSDLRLLKNAQSVRSLPIHPELIRLGFLEYVAAVRALKHELLFPEMHSPRSKSFAKTFYSSIFMKWRAWAFPEGTTWRHMEKGALKDKDVHSFRGTATSLMKGKVPDSVRIDILGHEGTDTMTINYDEEADLHLTSVRSPLRRAASKATCFDGPATTVLTIRPSIPRVATSLSKRARLSRASVPVIDVTHSPILATMKALSSGWLVSIGSPRRPAIATARVGVVLAAAWLAMIVAAALGAAVTPVYLSRPINLLFPMGVVAWRMSRDLPARGLIPVVWLAVLGFVAIGLVDVFGPELGKDELHLLYGTVSAVGIATITACERQRPIAVPRLLLALGAASYSIYLTHYPVLGALAQAIVHLGLRDALPVPLMFVLVVATTLAVGVGFHRLVERPLLCALRNSRLGDRRFTPRRASPASARAT